MPLLTALPWLAALCGALAVASAPWALGLPLLNIVFKPLATSCLIAWAWPRGVGDPARRWILAGLLLSWCGDVALLWPREGFLPGLVSFLLAHLAYLVAFTRHARWLSWRNAGLAYATIAVAVLSQLWPGVPAGLRGPVLAYVAALGLMAAQATSQWHSLRHEPLRAPLARRAAIGGALFMASDALLATDRFAGPVPLAGLWILLSYWWAQGLIAGSLAPSSSTNARS